jgi:type III restriction enzyme
LTSRDAAALARATANDEDRDAVEEWWKQERPAGVTARAPGDYAEPFRMPRLTIVEGDRRYLYEPEELDTFSWDLDSCDARLTEEQFATEVTVGAGALIDTDDREGGLFTQGTGTRRARQLELIGEGDDWSEVQLVRWLDSELHRGGSFAGLPSAQSQPWLRRVVAALLSDRGATLPILVRRRHALADVLIGRIAEHGRKQVKRAHERLIAEGAAAVETSPAMAMEIEESRYAPYEEHRGMHRFQKHAFETIGHMNDDEFACAVQIDEHPNVQRWLRNLDRESQNGFSLPLSPGRFFPDFLVELMDGRLAAVEYKNSKLALAEQHKRVVGVLWEERSGGQCVFAWVVEKDWQTVHRCLAAAEA